MGLFKLAVIGGAAYYAGKKLNEGNQNNGQGNQGGCGWKNRRQQWQQHQQQQNQQYDPSQNYGMNRELPNQTEVYRDYPEKAPMQPEYSSNYPQGYGYQPTQDTNRDMKSQPQMVGQGYGYTQPNQEPARDVKSPPQITMYEHSERVNMPPAYGRSMSPQQRMYPQQAQGQVHVSRAQSPQEQVQHQQMEFVEPKQRSGFEKLMWK